jgi:hypothetical protein
MSYFIVQGNLDPPLELTLLANGQPFDGSLHVVQLRWTKPDGTTSTVTLDPVDATLGQYQRTWVAGDTDLPGIHRARVIATKAGRPRHFPSDATFVAWRVAAL